jgi:hypothetical protein
VCNRPFLRPFLSHNFFTQLFRTQLEHTTPGKYTGKYMTQNRSLVSFFLMPTLALTLLHSFSAHADRVIFLVHGTWASTAEWSTADGDFFKAIEQSAEQHAQQSKNPKYGLLNFFPRKAAPEKIHVVPFTWAGEKNAVCRAQAARKLVKIMQSYPQDTKFSVIAHSHGVNVTLLASHYLAQAAPDQQRRIETLYALAGPVKETRYSPNMDIIDYVYNLFSFGDIVQPIFNKWHRVFSPHERIANLEVTINGQEPDHSQIHDPLVGASLPTLDLKLRAAHGNILFHEPGSLHFHANTPDPIYKRETYEARTQKLEEDQTHVKRRWAAFIASKASDAAGKAIDALAQNILPHAQPEKAAGGDSAKPEGAVGGDSAKPEGAVGGDSAKPEGAVGGDSALQAPAPKKSRWIPGFVQRFCWSKSACGEAGNNPELESKEEEVL